MWHEWGRGASELFANTKEAELFISGPASSILSGLLISIVIFPLPYEGRKRKSSHPGYVNRRLGLERKKSSYYRLNVFIENLQFAVDAFVHGITSAKRTLETKYPNFIKTYDSSWGENTSERQWINIVNFKCQNWEEKKYSNFVVDRFAWNWRM